MNKALYSTPGRLTTPRREPASPRQKRRGIRLSRQLKRRNREILHSCHSLRMIVVEACAAALVRPVIALSAVILLLGFAAPAISQGIPGSGDTEIGFARHLYGQGEYRLAAEEFHRFVERFTESRFVEEALFLEADCWFQLEKWQEARAGFRAFLTRYPVSQRSGIATSRLAAALFEMGDLNRAEQIYLEVAEAGGDGTGEALYWAGEAAFQRGDLSRTVLLMGQAVQALEPGETRSWALRRKGRALEDLGDLQAAVDVLNEVSRDRHALPEDLIARSRLLIVLGRPREAESVLSDLKERWSGWMQSQKAGELEARALWDQGKSEEAIDILEVRPTENPRLLGWMLLELDRADEAVDVLLPAMSRLEGEERSEAVLLLASGLRMAGAHATAESLLAVETASIAEEEFLSRAVLQRAELLVDLDRLEEAEQWLNRGFDLLISWEDSIAAFLLLGELESKREDWDAAGLAFVQARDIAPEEMNRELTYRAIVCAYRGEQWTEVKDLAVFLSMDPQDTISARAAFWAGEASSKEQAWKEAVEWYSTAVQGLLDGEEEARALFGLGWALFSQDEVDSALTAFRQAASTSPLSELSARAILRQGDVYMSMGEYIQASHRFRQASLAVAERSVGEEASIKLGKALAMAGKTEQAIRVLEEFFRSSQSSHLADDALFEKGEVFFRSGQYEKAQVEYQRVLNLQRDRELRDNALYRTADCKYNLGNFDGALASYLRLVKIYPESEMWSQSVQGALWAALQEGDADGALALCDSLHRAARDKERKQALSLAKADLLYGLDRYEEAFALYKDLPQGPEPRMRAAWCLEKMGEVAEATKAFKGIGVRWPDSPAAPEAAFQAARLARGAGRLKEAATLLQNMLADYPGSDLSDAARYDLGLIFLEAGSLTSAEEQWMILAHGPRKQSRDKAILRLCELEIKAGRPDSAMTLIEPLLQDRGMEVGAEAHWLAAEAELDRGAVHEARKLFLRLSYLFPDSPLSGDAKVRAQELAEEHGGSDN